MAKVAQVDTTEFAKAAGEQPKGYGEWVFLAESGELVETDEMYGEAVAQLDAAKSWTLMPPPISKK